MTVVHPLTPSTHAISLMTYQVLSHNPVSKDFPLDACFGEAMQVHQDDFIIDPIPEGLEELD